MSIELFDYVRKTAREFISYQMIKDIKSETGTPITHLVNMSLEKVSNDLINSVTYDEGNLTVADHSMRWNVRYWLYTEKASGFETPINPIPVSKEAENVLKKLSATANLSIDKQTFEKKTMITIYGLPDNNNSRSVLGELYSTLIHPIWGDLKLNDIIGNNGKSSQKLDDEEIKRRVEELNRWRIEDEVIIKDYKFPNYHDAMEFLHMISIVSRQEENSINLLVNKESIKAYMTGVTLSNILTAEKIEEIIDRKI